MFIAMNRFRVKKGSEDAFEKVWLNRDSHLDRVPGFVEFHLLRGPEGEGETLYASHTIWQSKGAFEAWTKIRRIPRRAFPRRQRIDRTSLSGSPEVEGFEVRQTTVPKAAVA